MQRPAAVQPVLLCATEFERRALERAGLGERAEIMCCGPGPARIVEWAETTGAVHEYVILAGLAGSLRETMRPGEAFTAATVIASNGRQYRTSDSERETSGEHRRRAVIASSDSIVTTIDAKRALAEKTGADLVDTESGVFAQAASILGWRWIIVRGVSDGHDQRLPPDIETWLKPDGTVRGWRIVWSLLRRPWFLVTVRRLARQSKEAMQAVAEILAEILEAEQSEPAVTDRKRYE